MKILGNFNLQSNEIQEASIQLSHEPGFPANPSIGRISFVDKIVWICADIQDSIPIWIPLTNQQSLYVHTQTVPSTNWVINHGLNSTFVIVTPYDGNNEMVIPDKITISNASSVSIDFGTSMIGKAVVVTGSLDGSKPPIYSVEAAQTEPTTNWVITHNLGYSPIVRVFIGNNEVQPNSISFPDANTVNIGFLSPQVGTVKLI